MRICLDMHSASYSGTSGYETQKPIIIKDNHVLAAGAERSLHRATHAQTSGQEADEILMRPWIKVYQTNNAPECLGFYLLLFDFISELMMEQDASA